MVASGKAEIGPDHVGEQAERSFARLEIAHQRREGVAVLRDLDEALVDIDGVAPRGGVTVDAREPAIRREAELPFVGWRQRLYRRRRIGAGAEIGGRGRARNGHDGANNGKREPTYEPTYVVTWHQCPPPPLLEKHAGARFPRCIERRLAQAIAMPAAFGPQGRESALRPRLVGHWAIPDLAACGRSGTIAIGQ